MLQVINIRKGFIRLCRMSDGLSASRICKQSSIRKAAANSGALFLAIGMASVFKTLRILDAGIDLVQNGFGFLPVFDQKMNHLFDSL